MRTMKLGVSNLTVPVVAVGCWRMHKLEQKEAEQFVRTAVDAGANFFDHGSDDLSTLAIWFCRLH